MQPIISSLVVISAIKPKEKNPIVLKALFSQMDLANMQRKDMSVTIENLRHLTPGKKSYIKVLHQI